MRVPNVDIYLSMSANISIRKLIFRNGTQIELAKKSITVFVGPNNAGKSATLREIQEILSTKHDRGVVLRDLEIEREGSADELISLLELYSIKEYNLNPLPSYKGYQFNVHEQNARNDWDSCENGLRGLSPFFASSLDTTSRLEMVNPPSNIAFEREYPQHPIHLLQRSDNLEEKFSEYFKKAFGTDLILNHGAGSQVPLHVGTKPIKNEGEDRISTGYISRIEKLPTLHSQGDGMKSFVGILLNTLIAHRSIFLIDEPEAFLHPPQARLLGSMIARDLPENRQVFFATHSEDFINGLLDIENENIKIIRIGREGDMNSVCELTNSDLEEAWGDPLLRYSNILSGLFHRRVIICEGDSDCRFYSAVLNAVYEHQNMPIPDVLFVHCGGKHRIPVAVKALRKLNVPVSVIVDIDILNDINPLQNIVEEMGGDWSVLQPHWHIVKSAIDGKRPELETFQLKSDIAQILDPLVTYVLPKDKLKEIEKLLKKASPWACAKESGKQYIPSGGPTRAFSILDEKLRTIGFHLVEVGEIEGFVKSVADHGPKWVSHVLESKNLASDPELQAARDFMLRVIS